MSNNTIPFTVQRCEVVFEEQEASEIFVDLDWKADSFPYFLIEWEDGAKLVIGVELDDRGAEVLDMNLDAPDGPFSRGFERWLVNEYETNWDALYESEAYKEAQRLYNEEEGTN